MTSRLATTRTQNCCQSASTLRRLYRPRPLDPVVAPLLQSGVGRSAQRRIPICLSYSSFETHPPAIHCASAQFHGNFVLGLDAHLANDVASWRARQVVVTFRLFCLDPAAQ